MTTHKQIDYKNWRAWKDTRDDLDGVSFWQFESDGHIEATAEIRTTRTKKDSFVNESGYRFEVRTQVKLTVRLGYQQSFTLETQNHFGGEIATVKNLLKLMANEEWHIRHATLELESLAHRQKRQDLDILNAVYGNGSYDSLETTYPDSKRPEAIRLYRLVNQP